MSLVEFVIESNFIEGIEREPWESEIDAHERLLEHYSIKASMLGDFQARICPGNPIREFPGMNVFVHGYVAPPGDPNIVRRLQDLCRRADDGEDPWKVHVAFELLHPYMDGNGRTGRALWLWQMKTLGRDPYQYSFLRWFYYQTLEAMPPAKGGSR